MLKVVFTFLYTFLHFKRRFLFYYYYLLYMATIINNDNLRKLVNSYIVDKSRLPDDLKDIPIGRWNVSLVTSMSQIFDSKSFNEPLDDWDVSNVTDMSHMFSGCTNFNQPLTRWNVSKVTTMSNMFIHCTNFNQPLDVWNVSNVTDMSFMFSGCTNFKQPLTRWKVSNVTDMSFMFSGCTNFNQPLDDWNVSNVTNMSYMFNDCTIFNQPLTRWNVSNVTYMPYMFQRCGISEENKPRFKQPVVVDALQIHKEAAKINYAKLNAFLKEKLNNVPVPNNIHYSSFINEKISKLINESGNTEETKVQQRNGLRIILDDRLHRLNYQESSMLIRESIFYTLNYVLEQPNTFKQLYLQTFIQDCIHAFEGQQGMTCANGALERIVFSLVPACVTEETNADYKTIIAIITANPSELIPIYIRDWYKLHKTGTDNMFPEGTTKEEMKSNLKSYLLEKLPDETVLIDEKIVEYADEIGYDKDSFMYGGKKRKTKKRKQTNKTNKTNKRKTKKRKQTNKKIKKTNKRKTKK